MKFHSWLGGVVLKAENELSKNHEIESLLPKNDMVFPLMPYSDKIPEAKVRVGEKVKIGQLIAQADDGTMGVYSTVSGQVKNIEKRRCADCKIYESIVVENDGKYDEVEFDDTVELEQINERQLLNLFGAYGIRDYKNNGIPLYEKLYKADSRNVKYIIINCMECEIHLSSIYRRLIDDPDLFIEGAKVFNHMYPKADCIFAIGDDKMDAVIEMEKTTKNEPRIKIMALPNKYPGGETKQLIYQITGNLYADEFDAISDGTICINAETLCAVRNAVFDGVPPMSRVITVSGSESVSAGNYEVLFGTSIDEIISLSGGEKQESYMVVAGGMMSGNIVEDRSVPVTDAVEAVLLLSKKDAPIYNPTDCIKCGYCVNVCPKRLVPAKLFEYIMSNNDSGFVRWHGDACISCGCCSYVCPANIPLTACFDKMNIKISGKGERKNGNR